KSVITETVDQQPTRLRPALLLIRECGNLCAGQDQHRTVFKFDVGENQRAIDRHSCGEETITSPQTEWSGIRKNGTFKPGVNDPKIIFDFCYPEIDPAISLKSSENRRNSTKPDTSRNISHQGTQCEVVRV